LGIFFIPFGLLDHKEEGKAKKVTRALAKSMPVLLRVVGVLLHNIRACSSRSSSSFL